MKIHKKMEKRKRLPWKSCFRDAAFLVQNCRTPECLAKRVGGKDWDCNKCYPQKRIFFPFNKQSVLRLREYITPELLDKEARRCIYGASFFTEWDSSLSREEKEKLIDDWFRTMAKMAFREEGE